MLVLVIGILLVLPLLLLIGLLIIKSCLEDLYKI